jgi:hypothetical protein
MTERLSRLPVRQIETLLAELHSWVQRKQRGEQLTLPEITLMVGEFQLRGKLLSYDQKDHMVFFQRSDTASALDATYLPLSSIQALTVHYTEDTLHVLSFGTVRPAYRAATRLSLDRQCVTLNEELTAKVGRSLPITIDWNSFSDNEATYSGVAQVVDDLSAILRDLVNETLGLDAVKKSIQRIEVRGGSASTVQVQAATLSVVVNVVADEVLPLTRAALKTALEATL